MRDYSHRFIKSFRLYLSRSPYLNAYGVDRNALKLVYDYLSDRSQKTKVGSSFSDYLDNIYGVPQGSILGPLLFNIDLCDLFFEDYSPDFANYADDTTP